jgi:hypothetical protein
VVAHAEVVETCCFDARDRSSQRARVLFEEVIGDAHPDRDGHTYHHGRSSSATAWKLLFRQ